jgi:hypothetical protein
LVEAVVALGFLRLQPSAASLLQPSAARLFQPSAANLLGLVEVVVEELLPLLRSSSLLESLGES